MKLKYGSEQKIFAYAVIIPILAWFLIFQWYPIFRALYVSFFSWVGFLDPRSQFTGFGNYQMAIFEDPVFLKSLKNTFIFTAEVIGIGLPLSLGIALLLNSANPKIASLLRTAYFLPVVASIIAVGLLWRLLYQPTFGLFNEILAKFGIPSQLWLKSVNQALQCIIMMALWKWIGFYMIIFLAALQSMPEIFYDAAKIDGATRWSCFRHITIPLLKPAFMFISVIWVISLLKVFEEVYILTTGGHGNQLGGGPVNSTMVSVLWTFIQAFHFQKLGYGCALSIIIFLSILAFSYIQVKFLRTTWEF